MVSGQIKKQTETCTHGADKGKGSGQMAIAKKMTQVTMQVMEALLGSDDLNDAMAEGLELLVNVLESTAGAVWVRDKEEDLYYHTAAVRNGPQNTKGAYVQ